MPSLQTPDSGSCPEKTRPAHGTRAAAGACEGRASAGPQLRAAPGARPRSCRTPRRFLRGLRRRGCRRRPAGPSSARQAGAEARRGTARHGTARRGPARRGRARRGRLRSRCGWPRSRRRGLLPRPPAGRLCPPPTDVPFRHLRLQAGPAEVRSQQRALPEVRALRRRLLKFRAQSG